MRLSKVLCWPFSFLISVYFKYTGKNNPERAVKDMKQAGVKVGENVHIFNSYIDYTYYNLLEIGNNVTITNATILLHDASTQKFMGYTKIAGVKIGDNVFVGYGSIILPGTKIGNDVIIGAGAVVRGDIPDDSVVIGNPGHIVCKTSEYISKNKAEFNASVYYDMHNQSDVDRMNPLLEKGFID